MNFKGASLNVATENKQVSIDKRYKSSSEAKYVFYLNFSLMFVVFCQDYSKVDFDTFEQFEISAAEHVTRVGGVCGHHHHHHHLHQCHHHSATG